MKTYYPNSGARVDRLISVLKIPAKGMFFEGPALPVAVGLAMVVAGPAYAVNIDSENPDIKMRWDNSVRYNLGVRTESRDPAIIGTVGQANSDMKFDRGDVITNRVDLLSEFDFVFKEKIGFRVSGQAWYDNAYDNQEKLSPALAGTFNNGSAYPGQQFTNFVKRWNRGPSAEFLDAFVFSTFDVGEVTNNVKLGSHNVFWGEAIFTPIHGVAYSQGPVDFRKSLANPGITAKELYKPLNQLSFTSLLASGLSVSGQYYFDWKPYLLADGGTYYGASDSSTQGGGTTIPAAGGFPWLGDFHQPKNKRGDWGLMTKWSPAWLGGGSFSLYHREYTDKVPAFVIAADSSGFGTSYLDDRTKLNAISFVTKIGDIAASGELVHRHNTQLVATGTTIQGSEPKGDTWHAVANLTGFIGKNPLFDSMAWITELSYSRLDKLSRNGANFNSVDYGCRGVTANLSCATKDALGIALFLEPKWFQVIDGVDLSMPIFYSVGLHGNSPVLFGGYKGAGSWSVGLSAESLGKYIFTLAYNDQLAKRTTGVVGGRQQVLDFNSGMTNWDRGNVTLTFKTTF